MDIQTIVSLLLLFVLGWVGLYMLYFHAIRPVLLTKIRFRLFALRDELRLLAAFREIAPSDKSYPIVERHLNMAVRAVEKIDLAEIICTKMTVETRLEIKQKNMVISDGDPRIWSIYRKSTDHLIAAIILNSPLYLVLAPPLQLGAIYIRRFREWNEGVKSRAWQVTEIFGSQKRPARC